MRIDDEMMRQSELDLLVDGELGEEKREAVLSSLDREPARWRELAIRFLERQVEKQMVRGLMRGETMIGRAELPVGRRNFFSWWRVGAVAASIAVAVGCVGIGMYLQRNNGETMSATNPQFVNAEVPGKMVGMPENVKITVPIVEARNSGRSNLFAVEDTGLGGGVKQGSKRSVIIEPDGKGSVMMIPVNTLPMKVY